VPVEPPVPGEPASASLALVVAVGACVVASAFFSLSETCLTSLTEARTQAIVARSGRRGRVLLSWLERPHEVLTTILVGNNVANIVATALMTRLALQLWGEVAVSSAVGIMTFLVLVFGEITPKTVARQHAVRLAVPVMHVLRVLAFALAPVTWLLARLATASARLTGGRGAAGSSDVTEDEIEAMIDLGSREKTIAPLKARYLRGVFGLGTRSAREIMVARTDVDAIDGDWPVEQIVRRLAESQFSRMPVYRGTIDSVVGILHGRDLLLALVGRRDLPTADELHALLREPIFVPETMVLERLLRLFRRTRQHLVVVLDEHGGTAGIVTLEDVLEELVGEIRDEHDDEESPVIVRRGPGRWQADGRIPLTALGLAIGVDLPRESVDTLAGLLMRAAGKVPEPGSRLELSGVRFEVLSGDEKRVGQVRVETGAEAQGETS